MATTEAGLAELEERAELQRSLGVPVEAAGAPPGVCADDVVGAVVCRQDGVADPPGVTRELVRRATERGGEGREQEEAAELDPDGFVIAAGPWAAETGRTLGGGLPLQPLCRQLPP